MKKIMTIDDLYKFCEEQQNNNNFTFFNFDADNAGYQLFITTPADFEVENSTNEMMLFANVRAFHTNTNNNKSNVSKKAMEKSLSGFKYKPVLCNFQTVTLDDDTEVLDFTGHDMDIDENGNIIYIEKQVGCFTADKPVMEYDEENDRYYACATVAIPREYTPAAEIIERKGGTDVSVELAVNKMSYDAKKKELLLEDIEVSGLTLLGVGHNPGMSGAKLQIEDFAMNGQVQYAQNDKLIEALDRLNKNLEEFQINNAGRKEEEHPMGEFERLLKKYNKTEQDITFDYKGMSDEELETAFKKAFDDPDPSGETEQPETPTGNDPPAGENNDPPATGNDDPLAGGSDPEPTEDDVAAAGAVTTAITGLSESITLEDAEDVAEAREAYDALTDIQKGLVTEATLGTLKAAEDAIANLRSADDKPVKKRKNNEVIFTAIVDGEIKEFAVSLIDKLNALRDLVNNTYSDSDDCWYDVDAYDEDKYVIMHDYWRNKHFRQSYAVRNDIYSLKGDRVEVFAQYLTQDEINSLSTMKSNYEQISNDLMQYQKKELIASNDYSAIATKEAFVKIADEVNTGKNEMTFEELKNTLDQALLDFAKSGNLDFEAIQQKEEATKKKGIKKIGLMTSNKKNGVKKSRYGNLFK